MAIFTEFAPAKLNLTLEVLGKRPDGYHELRSLVAFARDVGDVVTLDTSKPAGVTISGPFAGSIAGANLIETTLKLIAKSAPELQLGAVHLEKNLPVAAGIGGGSADAAALIRSVKKANGALADAVSWNTLAMQLGADVPVCLASRLSWVRGVGELIHPIEHAMPSGHTALIVNPLLPVPADKTAQVFRALQAPVLQAEQQNHRLPALTSEAEIASFIASGGNALERAALRVVPQVDDVLAALASVPGSYLARMSGGGPTCFALFADLRSAQSAAARLSALKPQWWIRPSLLS